MPKYIPKADGDVRTAFERSWKDIEALEKQNAELFERIRALENAPPPSELTLNKLFVKSARIANIVTDDIALGGRALMHTALFARAYSGSAVAGGNTNSAGSETTLTPYSWTLKGGTLAAPGDGFELFYTLALLSTEAGTKTFRMKTQQGAAAADTDILWESAAVTANLIINGRMILTRRNSGTHAITGINNEYVNATPATVTFYGRNTAAGSSLDFSLPINFSYTVQHSGASASVLLLTDLRALPHVSPNSGDGV